MAERNGTGPVFATDILGAPVENRLGNGPLSQRFLLPPFSVLDARKGEWQARKKLWVGLGIASELGRGGNLLELSDEAEQYRRGEGDYTKDARRRAKDAAPGGGGGPNSAYFAGATGPRPGSIQGRKKTEPTASLKGGLTFGLTMDPYKAQREANQSERKRRTQGPSQPGLVHHLTCGAYTNRGEEASAADCGTSIFDPVLCELMYRWFCPATGVVLDPFAGGSVRGIVAGMLGRRYWGCDLSRDQIAANEQQGRDLLGPGQDAVRWVCGDSADELHRAPKADFAFGCPPYGDLEQYSKDPRDLSNMDWAGFRGAYWDIIAQSCDKLRDDRFAAFVVGDFRDADGCYRNFPGDTIRAFARAGLKLYNEMILITAVGSLSIRTERQFFMSGKAGKTHQNVLVFVKGDPVRAMDAVSGKTADERRAELKQRAADRAAAAETEWGGE